MLKMGLKKTYTNGKIEAGCDEAGRGCLAGPVVAAAVILPPNFKNSILNDSKQLTERQREKLEPLIKKKALAYGIGIVDNVEIDEMNILNASFEAMHRAVRLLKIRPELLLIDGNRFNPFPEIHHRCIIKGDSKFLSIAAASILAKVHRDRMMLDYHQLHPHYEWNKNKGYPTKKHREAIFKHGDCNLHRLSFKLLADDQLKLNL